jgi:hypothetical protein
VGVMMGRRRRVITGVSGAGDPAPALEDAARFFGRATIGGEGGGGTAAEAAPESLETDALATML